MKKVLRIGLLVCIFMLALSSLPVLASSSEQLVIDSSSSDGDYYGWGATYSNAREAEESLTKDDSTNYIQVGQQLNANYAIYRGALFFDTSELPDNAIIDSATLSLRASGSAWPETEGYALVIVNGVDLNTPIVKADYGDLFSATTSYGSIPYSSWADSQWNDITLTPSGISAISKTGTTPFGLRAQTDIDGVAPTAENEETYLGFYSNESGSYTPQLTINYSVESPGYYYMARILTFVWIGIVILTILGLISSGMPLVSVVIIGGIIAILGSVGVQAIIGAIENLR